MKKPISLAITTLMTVVGLQLLLLPRSSTIAQMSESQCSQPTVSGQWLGFSFGSSKERRAALAGSAILPSTTAIATPGPQGPLAWLRNHATACTIK
ncbi:MAG TPA: hypothetical protein V6D46_03585 [Coleofasciculaceae cyanobacterium]